MSDANYFQSDRLHAALKSKTLWATAVAAVALVALLFLVSVSFTTSLQTGFYANVSTPDSLQRGGIIAFCVEEEYSKLFTDRGYTSPPALHLECETGRLPHMKRIWAVAGDTVTVSLSGIHVNGVTLAPHPVISDSDGRLMPVKWGTHVIEKGSVWAGSDRPGNVLDSRYQGPIDRSNITGSRRLLLPRTEAPIFAEDVSRLGIRIIEGTATADERRKYALLLPFAHAGDHDAILHRYDEQPSTPTDLLLSSQPDE